MWIVILVKLFVMFVILRVFFFAPYLKGKSELEKQQHVGCELIERGIK